MKRFLFTLVLGIAATAAIWYSANPFFEKTAPEVPKLSLTGGTLLTPTKPMINFSLTNTDNQTFTEASLLKHWTLLFFGYTECPEICPKTLAIVSQVWRTLPKEFQNQHALRFVFVSLDPKSDTIQSLNTFLSRFNSSFVGLTGEEEMIKKLSKSCSVYSWQDPNANVQGPKIIDHSATLILINPQGHMQALFSPPHDVTALTQDLQTVIEKS